MILPWHKSAFAKLQNMVEKNHLPHAIMISGPEKIGKLELAIQFIKNIICEKNGCNECLSCRQINNDNINELALGALIRRSNHPNLIFCKREASESNNIAESIKVDQIRKFCEVLNKTAQGLQVGVIFYTEEMNINAVNCLLKTLEEPRENTLIILLTHNTDKVIPTILSRCQNVHIPATFDEQSANWIIENYKKDKQFDALQLLDDCHGVPFKALDYLSNNHIEKINDYREKLIKMALENNITIINNIKYDLEKDVLESLQNIIIEVIKIKIIKVETKLADLKTIANNSSANNLFLAFTDVSYAIKSLKNNINKELLLNNILINWSNINKMTHYHRIFNN